MAVASGVNTIEWVHESIECSGAGTEPYTDAQFEAVAQLVAEASKALGIPVNRSTVVVHADINSVSRRSDPWPPATREVRVKRVPARANAILRPPIVTVTVKAGDTLSEIAWAHGLALATLLAFAENAKYPANPGLIHPGDVVRVKDGGAMDSQPGTIWGREPAIVLALVQAVIAPLVAFGLNLAPHQIGASSPSRPHPRTHDAQPGEPGMSDGHLRDSLPRTPTACQIDSCLRSSPPAGPCRMRPRASASDRAPRSATSPTYGLVRSHHRAADLLGRAEGGLVVPALEDENRTHCRNPLARSSWNG